MPEVPRISVEVTEEFRRKLHAALSLKGTNATQWVKEMGQREIDEMEGNLKKPLETASALR